MCRMRKRQTCLRSQILYTCENECFHRPYLKADCEYFRKCLIKIHSSEMQLNRHTEWPYNIFICIINALVWSYLHRLLRTFGPSRRTFPRQPANLRPHAVFPFSSSCLWRSAWRRSTTEILPSQWKIKEKILHRVGFNFFVCVYKIKIAPAGTCISG